MQFAVGDNFCQIIECALIPDDGQHNNPCVAVAMVVVPSLTPENYNPLLYRTTSHSEMPIARFQIILIRL